MAFNLQQHQQQQDIVSGEQYRYALTNFRIAHEKVEQQRAQLEEQEKQVALLRARIATLEGTASLEAAQQNNRRQGGTSVDDYSIKNAASMLERQINRWATDIIRNPPANMQVLHEAALADVTSGDFDGPLDGRPMVVQNLLRHAMSEVISEAIINCLIVTSSSEANIQLTRIHEHIFSRDPTVASVWRRQTFSAAVDSVSPSMSRAILEENMGSLLEILGQPLDPNVPTSPLPCYTAACAVLEAAYEFSRMLHGSPTSSGPMMDAFYRSFVPELGNTLYPRQVELVKRCVRSERGEIDKVGATIFPGLVKVTRAPGGVGENVQTVVRRAQVICECALAASNPNTPS